MKSLYWKICATFLVVELVSILAGLTVFDFVLHRLEWNSRRPLGGGPGEEPAKSSGWRVPFPDPPPAGPPLMGLPGPPGPPPMHAQMAESRRRLLRLIGRFAINLVQKSVVEKDPRAYRHASLTQLVAGHKDIIAAYVAPDGSVQGPAPDWIPRGAKPLAEDLYRPLAREGFAVRMPVPDVGGVVYVAQEPFFPDFPDRDRIALYLLQSGMTALGAILFVAILVGFIAFRAIARRLREVGSCLEAAARGELSRRVNDKSDDEIGRLGSDFNHMAQQLAETLARLEAVDERRREFLAHVSHELRTPITSVRANLETLLEPGAEPEAALTHSMEEIDHMACLVEDLLELARMDSPTYKLAREEVVLQQLVDNMVSRLRTSLNNRAVQVVTHYSPDPVRMQVDARRIGQAVTNLLVNAIRSFNDGGTIDVVVREDPGHAVIEIADTGRGIPEAVRARLFEPFQTGTYGGTGLGLTIVRKLVEAHGGTIELSSRPGGGTTARVVLALA